MSARQLTPEEAAMIWDALTVRISDPVMAHEKEQTRELRSLLTSSIVTIQDRDEYYAVGG